MTEVKGFSYYSLLGQKSGQGGTVGAGEAPPPSCCPALSDSPKEMVDQLQTEVPSEPSVARDYKPSNHHLEPDTRPSATPCPSDLSMLQDVFMRWRHYVLGHDPRRLLCAEAEKQAALDQVGRLEHELIVSEARASHWQAEAERLRGSNGFSGQDAATAVGSLEAANPSVAKCVTQRLLHTITRLFSVLELTGAQLEDDAFDEVFKALQEAGFDGIEGHASRAKEKSSPPGVLSAIIHAWQALTVYHEAPMDWTAVHRTTGEVIRAATLRRQCDPVRTSGRLQRVDRARALADKAAIMLRQWAGYLRSEKREKTKELYFWTDYVITHEDRQLEVDASVLDSSVKGDDIGATITYLVECNGCGCNGRCGQAHRGGSEEDGDETRLGLSFLEEALASLTTRGVPPMMACNKTRKSNRHGPAYPYANGFAPPQYPPQPQAPPRGACNGHAWAQCSSYTSAAPAPSAPPPQHANNWCAPPVPPPSSRSPAFYPPHHSAHRPGPPFHSGATPPCVAKTSARVMSPPSGLGVANNGYESSSSSGSAHHHNRGGSGGLSPLLQSLALLANHPTHASAGLSGYPGLLQPSKPRHHQSHAPPGKQSLGMGTGLGKQAAYHYPPTAQQQQQQQPPPPRTSPHPDSGPRRSMVGGERKSPNMPFE